MQAIGIIGGTGLETARPLVERRVLEMTTAYGPVTLIEGNADGVEIVFISRHGSEHETLAHAVNHRANIAALRDRGVRQVIATNAVGSLRPDLPPGRLVILSDFIDMTRRRHEPLDPSRETHVDFTTPYCPRLRAALLRAARSRGLDVEPSGVYLGVDGPRFETPAEVRAFGILGADVVGMTGLPEAVLAREAGLCYAAIAVVTNFAAGITADGVAHDRVALAAQKSAPTLWDLAIASATLAGDPESCQR